MVSKGEEGLNQTAIYVMVLAVGLLSGFRYEVIKYFLLISSKFITTSLALLEFMFGFPMPSSS